MTNDLTTLRSLRERCERATGPAREIDEAIAIALGLRKVWKSKHGYWNFDPSPEGGKAFNWPGRPSDCVFDSATGEKLPEESLPRGWAWEADLPEYTSSIDAALALVERVLPGWRKQFFECPSGLWIARVIGPRSELASNDALPLPLATLAIICALLTALIEKETRA